MRATTFHFCILQNFALARKPPRGMKFDKNAEISEEIPAFERNLDYFAVIENQVFALLSPNTASTVKFSYAALWTRIWLSQ